ncbi:MAG: hypothetical protein ABL997_10000 [Planctomycetota bacterium]
MTRHPLRLATFLLLTSALTAQLPDDPPPWWNYSADDETVSLYWDFANAGAPLIPTAQVLPTWFSPPPGPGMFSNSGNITWVALVNGQTGVLGLTGAGSGTISVLVDNDPQPTHTKTVFLQYDGFASNGSSVKLDLGKDLLKYKRRIVSQTEKSLGNGWVQTTLEMELTPQPDSEVLNFALVQSATGTAAIDNLYVSTHCDKWDGGKEGAALGEIDTASLNIDLGLATGGAIATAAAATENLAGVLTYWIAGRNTSGDQLYVLDSAGAQIAPPVLYPAGIGSLEGASDLAVAEFFSVGGTSQKFVYGIVDRRATNGTVAIFAVDANGPTPTLVPARTVVTAAINGPGPLGLAFSRFGNGGAGSFWVSDQNGIVTELDLIGLPVQQLSPAQNGTPTGLSGAAFDDETGQFYWFSQTPRATPAGLLRINGFVHDGYSLQREDIEWIADRSFPSPFGPGGTARGLELVRRSNGDFRLLCVQQLGTSSRLTVVKGPFQFGLGHVGRMGMRGGLPAFGNPNFQLTLRGCPNAAAAILYLGFSNTLTTGIPLPIDLTVIGLDESDLAIDASMSFPLQLFANGNVAQPLPLPPPSIVFNNVPAYFQWLVLDPNVITGMATSQAGETILY